MRLSRIGIVIGITAAWACVASFAATPAQAGLLSCGNGSQTFQPVDGDATTYYSMANGGFESGSSGWSLSGGASVVSGNEPWSVAGGTHSLSLPSGSSAVGPKTCIALLSPALRMFASDAGGKDGGLRVTIEYRSLLGALLGIKSYTLFDPAAYKRWQPAQRSRFRCRC